jgi:hypothetical protein
MAALIRLIACLSVLGTCQLAWSMEIPFSFKPGLFGGGWMEAPCTIGGRQTICKIDSGANMSSVRLSPETADFEKTGQVTYTSASGHAIKCDLVIMPAISVGSESRTQFESVRCPVVDVRTELNIVGLDFFAGKKVTLDMKANKIHLAAEAPKNSNAMPFTTSSVGHVLIPVRAGHKFQPQKETVAMFDTGAAITVISSEFVQNNPQYFTLIKEIDQGRDTHGNVLEARLMIMSGLAAGDRIFAGEYVMAIDFTSIKKLMGQDVDLILGQNIIKNAKWYLDLQEGFWSVQ